MDILYVVGTGSAWKNNELRYSLRSINKNGVNVGRIFIATETLPKFINPEAVEHICIRDLGKIKHRNIMDKIECVMNYSDIADDFLLSSDDHFYIRETDFDRYPLYHKGEIQERDENAEYWLSMRDTHFFSIFDSALNCGIKEYLREMFPNKSRWEK